MKNYRTWLAMCLIAAVVAGCGTTPPQPPINWSLPPNLGKTKADINITMHGPMTTDGRALLPGLAQQFVETVKTKMIQAKRFHVYMPNAFGELPQTVDSDITIKPFVDFIDQPVRIKDTGREGVCFICKVMLDVKMTDNLDGEATEAINLDGVCKVEVPSVFGQVKEPDRKGLLIKAFEEAYKLLESEINKHFPPAAKVANVRCIENGQGQEPLVKINTVGGENIGFKDNSSYKIFTMVEGSPIVVALLDVDAVMAEKAAFKVVVPNNTDPEALGIWSRMKDGANDLQMFVTPDPYNQSMRLK